MDPNEMARLLIDQSPDAVIFADRNGTIREWNAAAEAVFGHVQAETLGQSLDIIIPEEFREAHWRGFDAAIETGETKYRGQGLPTRALHKDGSHLYVELTFAIIRGRDHSVLGALAHVRDITERWERERDQRNHLRDLESRLDKSA